MRAYCVVAILLFIIAGGASALSLISMSQMRVATEPGTAKVGLLVR
jgi:hypothetical protein